jgi:translation elongation factor EF-G
METTNLVLPVSTGLGPLKVTCPVECDGRCVRQVQALPQFAVVKLTITPLPDPNAVLLVDDCKPVDQLGSDHFGDVIALYRRGIARGITDVLVHYRNLGFRVTGAMVAVSRMVVHDVDSSEEAFRVAARNAFASGLVSAGLSGEGQVLEN